jgi:hypothetical protein
VAVRSVLLNLLHTRLALEAEGVFRHYCRAGKLVGVTGLAPEFPLYPKAYKPARLGPGLTAYSQ